MNQNCRLRHIALNYSDKKKADIFFIDILGLKFEKKFYLSSEISQVIFGIKKEVEIIVYKNENSYFEIFLTESDKKPNFEHICIEISDKQKLINDCKKNRLETISVKKDEKLLLFIKDFEGYLYEIKEKI